MLKITVAVSVRSRRVQGELMRIGLEDFANNLKDRETPVWQQRLRFEMTVPLNVPRNHLLEKSFSTDGSVDG